MCKTLGEHDKSKGSIKTRMRILAKAVIKFQRDNAKTINGNSKSGVADTACYLYLIREMRQ